VSDIRNSKVVDVINELRSFDLKVDVFDPHASPEEFKKEYGFELSATVNPRYDAIVVAVNHNEFLMYDEKYFLGIAHEPAVLFDLKGIYRGTIYHLNYWTL
jgi:UDP-N-acetyl-D-galactosamine dehydrogenase